MCVCAKSAKRLQERGEDGGKRGGGVRKNHRRRDECQESNHVTPNEETKVPELNKGQP